MERSVERKWDSNNLLGTFRANGVGAGASSTGAKVNFREREKQILDKILGPGNYDRRIRPSGINSTGERSH